MKTYLETERDKAMVAAVAKAAAVLPGCAAYPTSGQPSGPDVDWCREARGNWCPRKCKWIKL